MIVIGYAVYAHLPFGLAVNFAWAAAARDNVMGPVRRSAAAACQAELRTVVTPRNFRNVACCGGAGDAVVRGIPIRRPHVDLVEVGATYGNVERRASQSADR